MAASPSSPDAPHPPPQGGNDPSMEEILASIRRILSEDEADSAPPSGAAGPDVVPLDPSMLVEEPPVSSAPPSRSAPPPEEPPTVVTPPPQAAPAPRAAPAPGQAADGLLAPETAAAASSSLGSLLRTLAERQHVAVRAGGPTIEDLVREELRPMLKAWLDTHLPPLVERLVRAEIERVVGRALS
jgi:cell pole-organizing protein PopZ